MVEVKTSDGSPTDQFIVNLGWDPIPAMPLVEWSDMNPIRPGEIGVEEREDIVI